MELKSIQKQLAKYKLDGFWLTRGNLFIGQDVLPEENLIYQLTGFTGSAGNLLILPEKCLLFVDGRYALQAPQQVNKKEVEVICTVGQSFKSWLQNHCASKKIGYTPWCCSIQEILNIKGPQMVADASFLPYKQAAITANVFEHDIAFCGQSREEKIARAAEELQHHNLSAALFTSADSVSWLLNLRSDALPDTPVFRGMVLLDIERHVWIFSDNCNTDKLPSNLKILPLTELEKRLKKFKKQSIGIGFSCTPAAVYSLMQANNINIVRMKDICQEYKAIKNPCEQQGITDAHIRDGAAVCKFLYWLEHHKQGMTELDIVKKLHDFRAKNQNYISESFETIAAFGSNGAIVHYSPTAATNKKLEDGNMLLLDSGAQYLDGTTDITRTIAVGNVPPQMIDDFTLVLKGNIALSRTNFPTGTCGYHLDAVARQPLWQEGKNYNHGTGHGVGCFLNVHEGPHSISQNNQSAKLQAGMITSIEPGFYQEQKYGIRIENLALIVPSEHENFLKFKILTLVPIDKRLINEYLLSDGERKWLNAYHQEVFSQISPLLNAAEKDWLQEACAPI